MDVPDVVRAKARAAGATGWLGELPALVADLESEWGITVGPTFPDATEAYVAAATTASGEEAVLKLLVPRQSVPLTDEITVLRLADGEGCVRLLNADESRYALLLERLGPSMADLDVPVAERHAILCDVAERVWRPAPDASLATGATKARWLIEHVTRTWEELDRPCSEAAVDHAISCGEARFAAHDDERARLVHGDVHQWNTLRAGEGWKLVDPDGLLADPEYDLGIIMREDPDEILRDGEDGRAAHLAARTGTDPRAILDWGAIERVSTGLLGTVVGLQPVARLMLAAADRVAADRRG